MNKCIISNPTAGKSVTIENCKCNEIQYNSAGNRLEIAVNFDTYAEGKTISDSLNFDIAKVELYNVSENDEGVKSEQLIYTYTEYNDIDRKVLSFGDSNEAHLNESKYSLYLLLV